MVLVFKAQHLHVRGNLPSQRALADLLCPSISTAGKCWRYRATTGEKLRLTRYDMPQT